MNEEALTVKNKKFIISVSILIGILIGIALSWLSIHLSSVEVVAVSLGLLLLVLSFYKPLWGLLILIGFFLSPGLFNTPEVTSSEIYWGILLAAGFSGALARAFFEKRRLLLPLKEESFLWGALFFLLWGAISLLMTLREGEQLVWWLRKYGDFVGYFLIFWVVWCVSEKEESWVKILLGLFFFIGIVKGIQQLIWYYNYFPEAMIENNLALLRRGAYAEFFGFPGSILAICFYLHSQAKRDKIFYGILILFFLLLLGLSFTRGLWLGFGISLLVLLIGFKGLRTGVAKVLAFFLLFLGAILGGAFFFQQGSAIYLFHWIGVRLFSSFRLKFDLSLLDRFAEWKSLWVLSWQKPFLGHGIGHSFTFYSINPWSWVEIGGVGRVTIRYSHNLYLYLFYTLGMVGLFLFLFMIFEVLKTTRKIWNKTKDPFTKAYCAAFFSICTGFLVTAITCPIFMAKTNSVLIGLLMGIVAIFNRKILVGEERR
jgi:O-antigen ligase